MRLAGHGGHLASRICPPRRLTNPTGKQQNVATADSDRKVATTAPTKPPKISPRRHLGGEYFVVHSIIHK